MRSPSVREEEGIGRRGAAVKRALELVRHLWVTAKAGALHEEAGDEERIVPEIPFPEAARLLHQPIQPFEADSLQKPGCLGNGAGVEIEGGADAEHERGVEFREITGHEALLFGCAEAHPEAIRPGGGNHGGEFRVLRCIERPEGGRVGADDLDAGKALFEVGFDPFGQAGLPP